MKNLVVTLFLVAVFFASAASLAQAQDKYGVYFTPKVFYSHLTADADNNGKYSDNVAGGALAIGYDFNARDYGPIRAEIEFAMRGKGKRDDVYNYAGFAIKDAYEISTSSIFANVYYDFHNSSDFTPYIGAGLGTARIKFENKASISDGVNGLSLSTSKSSWKFAWNVGAGVAYRLTDTVSLDLGYRYADFGSLDQNALTSIDVTGHEVLLGVRFAF